MSFTRVGYLLDGEYWGSSRRERSSFKALRLALEERNAIGALAWPFPFPNSSYTHSLNRILRSQIHQPRSELARFTPPPFASPTPRCCSVCPNPSARGPWHVTWPSFPGSCSDFSLYCRLLLSSRPLGSPAHSLHGCNTAATAAGDSAMT